MSIYKDQLGRKVYLKDVPKRIISLVPSQTEFLFDLGLDKEIIGVTKFCVHPKEKLKGKTKIGGTKNFNFKQIHLLKPDLIIGNKEENYKEGIERLHEEYPVWISDIGNLEEALQMMAMVGTITNRKPQADKIIQKIGNDFINLHVPQKKDALYLIWKEPYMSIGGDTFINHLMDCSGFKNVLSHLNRYPIISEEEIKTIQPEYILLSSEPYPFKDKHIAEFKALSPKSTIVIVDGEMFSWFGSRLQFSVDYFKKLHSELIN